MNTEEPKEVTVCLHLDFGAKRLEHARVERIQFCRPIEDVSAEAVIGFEEHRLLQPWSENGGQRFE